MGDINYGRVLLGGLLSGVAVNVGEFVLNGVILADQMTAAMARLGIEETPAQILAYVVFGFVLGLVAVWIYAAIRPRFGPGPKTAVFAGLTVWVLVWGTFTAVELTLHLYGPFVMWLSLAWGLVEMPAATILGAWPYKEQAAV